MIPRPISLGELEAYMWGAATLLRGVIDAGDYKGYIFPLLFWKRLCDVYDEEFETALSDGGGDLDFAAYAENHRFQIPSGAHWNTVREVNQNVGRAIQNAMRSIESVNPDYLAGIFGDASWTNTNRLSDAALRDLLEHFSSLTLSVANVPEDELGVAYEFLIKKFADDSGHTAAEFYTNRTVVHLMAELLDPQIGESVYDPTCGSGGMLLSCAMHLKRAGKEWRSLKLFGQERNLMTSSIARMNLLLHGFEEFQVARGDTLSEPKLVENDTLRRFDVVLANPPYSINQWDRDKWDVDRFKRNFLGLPPQGRADYAFWGHILASMGEEKGRSAILFPHGVLFRDEERAMRKNLIARDKIEAVIGLGPNLFYNSPMESCVVVCRSKKAPRRRGKILFIQASGEVTRERAQSFLKPAHIERIRSACEKFADEDGFCRVVTTTDIAKNEGNLNIPLYVKPIQKVAVDEGEAGLMRVIENWRQSGIRTRQSIETVLERLEGAV